MSILSPLFDFKHPSISKRTVYIRFSSTLSSKLHFFPLRAALFKQDRKRTPSPVCLWNADLGRPGGSSGPGGLGARGAHLLRLVPLLGLGRQVLRLRREVRRLRLLVVVRLLALLAVATHTLLSVLRWHLSTSQAKQASKSKWANSMESNTVSIQQHEVGSLLST